MGTENSKEGKEKSPDQPDLSSSFATPEQGGSCLTLDHEKRKSYMRLKSFKSSKKKKSQSEPVLSAGQFGIPGLDAIVEDEVNVAGCKKRSTSPTEDSEGSVKSEDQRVDAEPVPNDESGYHSDSVLLTDHDASAHALEQVDETDEQLSPNLVTDGESPGMWKDLQQVMSAHLGGQIQQQTPEGPTTGPVTPVITDELNPKEENEIVSNEANDSGHMPWESTQESTSTDLDNGNNQLSDTESANRSVSCDPLNRQFSRSDSSAYQDVIHYTLEIPKIIVDQNDLEVSEITVYNESFTIDPSYASDISIPDNSTPLNSTREIMADPHKDRTDVSQTDAVSLDITSSDISVFESLSETPDLQTDHDEHSGDQTGQNMDDQVTGEQLESQGRRTSSDGPDANSRPAEDDAVTTKADAADAVVGAADAGEDHAASSSDGVDSHAPMASGHDDSASDVTNLTQDASDASGSDAKSELVVVETGSDATATIDAAEKSDVAVVDTTGSVEKVDAEAVGQLVTNVTTQNEYSITGISSEAIVDTTSSVEKVDAEAVDQLVTNVTTENEYSITGISSEAIVDTTSSFEKVDAEAVDQLVTNVTTENEYSITNMSTDANVASDVTDGEGMSGQTPVKSQDNAAPTLFVTLASFDGDQCTDEPVQLEVLADSDTQIQAPQDQPKERLATLATEEQPNKKVSTLASDEQPKDGLAESRENSAQQPTTHNAQLVPGVQLRKSKRNAGNRQTSILCGTGQVAKAVAALVEEKEEEENKNRKSVFRHDSVDITNINAIIEEDTGNTKLHVAALEFNAQSVKECIKSGANVNKVNRDYRNALHELVLSYVFAEAYDQAMHHKNFLEIVKTLSAAQIDMNQTDLKGNTALHYVVGLRYQQETIKELLTYGCRINIGDSRNQTCLHLAVIKGDYDTVQVLLNTGGDPNQPDAIGQTSLHLAASGQRHAEIIKLLIDQSANIEATDRGSRTPLHVAAKSGRVNNVDVFLQHQASVFAREGSGQTPLHLAAAKDPTEKVVKLLLGSLGPYPNRLMQLINQKDVVYGDTALHKAVKHRKFANVRILCHFKSDPNIENNNNETAGHLAASVPDICLWSVLADSGIDFNRTDNNGLSVLDKAKRMNNAVIVRSVAEYQSYMAGRKTGIFSGLPVNSSEIALNAKDW